MASALTRASPPGGASTIVSRLKDGGRAVVAMSGGVDSSLVAALAFEALGSDALAVTLIGPSVSRSEVERARSVARFVGIDHRLISADPLADPEYRANRSDRCYHCRSVETSAVLDFGRREGVRQFLDGIQQDDLADERPGLRAMNEAGFLHPLLWVRWGKLRVREEAQRRGLPNWDQPSDACLASRVAHGEPVSAELLSRIEEAEEAVRGFGFRRVRVRVQGRAARIEVDPDEVPRLLAEPLANRVVAAVQTLGFEPVRLDPRGYGASLRRLPTIP